MIMKKTLAKQPLDRAGIFENKDHVSLKSPLTGNTGSEGTSQQDLGRTAEASLFPSPVFALAAALAAAIARQYALVHSRAKCRPVRHSATLESCAKSWRGNFLQPLDRWIRHGPCLRRGPGMWTLSALVDHFVLPVN